MERRKRGPLRTIVEVIVPASSRSRTARVRLSCGHETRVWGTHRNRALCPVCREQGRVNR